MIGKLEFKPILETKGQGKFLLLFKGEGGSGKTHAAASFPKPILWADYDEKAQYLHYYYGKEYCENIFGCRPATYQSLHKQILKLIEYENEIKTFVLDSLTTFSITIIDAMLSGGTESEGARLIRDVPVLTWPGYNAESGALVKIICKDLVRLRRKMNVILTAHVIGDTKDKSGMLISRRLLTGGQKVSSELLQPIFHDSFHFYSEDVAGKQKFTCVTRSKNVDWARTNSRTIPTTMDWTGAGLKSKPSFYEMMVKHYDVEEG